MYCKTQNRCRSLKSQNLMILVLIINYKSYRAILKPNFKKLGNSRYPIMKKYTPKNIIINFSKFYMKNLYYL